MTKIMLVEDDLLLVRMYQRKFLDENYDVTVAVNGKEALKKINAGYKPDIILLDVMMPLMNGFEFLEQYRKKPATIKAPVLFLTNLDDLSGESRTKGLALGAVDYVIKDKLSAQGVVDKIEKVLSSKKKSS